MNNEEEEDEEEEVDDADDAVGVGYDDEVKDNYDDGADECEAP